MRNPRPVIGALAGVALVAALATVASSQTTSSKATEKDKAGSSTSATMQSEGAAAPDLKTPLRLRAFAVNMNNAGARNSGTLDIVVERWSTDAEVDKLRGVLQEKP